MAAVEPPRVRDVMTNPVVAVRERANYKEIVDALDEFGVSAVPVLDSDDRVVGVVSVADLLPKVEFPDEGPGPRLFERLRRRTARAKAAGETAGELMSSPAITTRADTTIVEAARLMEAERVKRLPVVGEEGRLAGIVTRRDLLRVYLRPDADIRADVRGEVLDKALGVGPSEVTVEVDSGVVRLAGKVERRSTAQDAVRLARTVPGVVHVVDELTYRHDDQVDIGSGRVFETRL
ncbi:CBS domain-containing protein [Planosporangium flavigriseum]|nr:CBS domain-containing protein [Planosporangium flavigriseum]